MPLMVNDSSPVVASVGGVNVPVHGWRSTSTGSVDKKLKRKLVSGIASLFPEIQLSPARKARTGEGAQQRASPAGTASSPSKSGGYIKFEAPPDAEPANPNLPQNVHEGMETNTGFFLSDSTFVFDEVTALLLANEGGAIVARASEAMHLDGLHRGIG